MIADFVECIRRMRPRSVKGQFRALTDKIILAMFMIKFVGARSTPVQFVLVCWFIQLGCFVQSEAFLKDAKHATLPKFYLATRPFILNCRP